MRRIIGGVFVLLLGMPAMWAEDEPKKLDKPTTPAEEYRALLNESQYWWKAVNKAIREAVTPEDRHTALVERQTKNDFAARFVALAEKYPKDDVAVEALIWVTTESSNPPRAKEWRTKAIEILLRDHIQNEKLGRLCQTMTVGVDKQNEQFLRTVLENNKNAEVQAEACLSLVLSLSRSGAKGAAESEKLCKELTEKHVTNLKPERLAAVCQQSRFSTSKSGEFLLRYLLEKDTRPEVQGVACLTLAQVLRGRADQLSESDPKVADLAREEAEKLFEQAAEKHADVKTLIRANVGTIAKRELFDLRRLSTGKTVPDVEGEDQDGQKFKLSDYKGKVVLLDFWSEF